MVDNIVIVTDPKRIKVGIEETRRHILSLLKIKAMTVAELAEALNKDQSTIYRHIEKLTEHDYVEASDERRIHHIPEKIYSRTAMTFLLSPDKKLAGEDIDLMKKMTEEHGKELATILSQVKPEGEIEPEALTELLWFLWEHTISDIKDLKERNVEMSIKEIHVFNNLSILKAMRSDPEFADKLNDLLEKAGL